MIIPEINHYYLVKGFSGMRAVHCTEPARRLNTDIVARGYDILSHRKITIFPARIIKETDKAEIERLFKVKL